jgi:hypothetical protein
MKKIYTFLKSRALFVLLASSLLSSSTVFGQCGSVVENFNNTGGSTAGFTGSFSYGTNNLVRDRVLTNGVYVVTSPTYQLPNAATTVGYGFTLGGTERVEVTVRVIYISTITGQLETFNLREKIVPAYNPGTNTAVICDFADLSTIPGFPTGGKYRLQFEITPRTGDGAAGQTVTFDDFATNGTFSQIPLPVNFIGFEAKRLNSNVQLTWKVAGEENVSHYEVERSNDGRSFATIGNVSKTGRDIYTYTDATTSSTIYYRVKNVDNDGQFKYSTIARIVNGKSEIVLRAFPQPVQSKLTVQHPSIDGKALVSVSTADGRTVRTIVPANGSMQTYVDMNGLQKGMYVIRFDSGDGNIQTMKVLKQ